MNFWPDMVVIGAVVIFFVSVIYKAMPEPINAIFSLIGRIFGFVGEKTVGGVSGASEVITYG